MSFSKAKILRFNECKNDAPPPGTYDPEFGVMMKGLITAKKKKRLAEKQYSKCNNRDCRQKRSIEKCAFGNCLKSQSKSAGKKELHMVAESSCSTQSFYMTSLAKANSHRVILEEKISQQEMDISQLAAVMEKLMHARLIQESFNQSLQADLDNVESELAHCKVDVKNLKGLVRKLAAEMVVRKHRCEVTMDESQATIAVLRQRLLEKGTDLH